MILVTGGTGLVGAHLLLSLAERGKNIRALYRTTKNIQKTKNLFAYNNKADLFTSIEWIQGDIIDLPSLEEAFKGVEYVYHAAAMISFDPADEEILRKTNIEGTANIINCALDFGIKKFCYVSSVAALGDPKEGELVITEETDWNPEMSHSDYALSKHGGEMEVWRGWQEGLKVVIVNPAVIFGYGFWDQGSGKMLTSVHKGQQFYTKGKCGIVAVEDVIEIMLRLMDSDVSGQRYTLAADNLTVLEILSAIAGGMNKKHPSTYAAPWMTSFAWRADWLISKLLGRPRSFTRSMARSSHALEVYDNTKICEELNYRFKDMKTYIAGLANKFTGSQA